MGGATAKQVDTLGTRIRELRRSLGLSQARLAAILGVDQSNVSRWENGARPDEVYIQRLAELAGIHPAELHYGLTQPAEGAVIGGAAFVRRKVPIVGAIGPAFEIVFYPNDDPHRDLEMVDCPDQALGETLAAVRVDGEALPLLGEGALAFFRLTRGGVEPDCINRMCVVKLKDEERILLREVRRGSRPDTYFLIGWITAPIENARLAWASPILIMKP